MIIMIMLQQQLKYIHKKSKHEGTQYPCTKCEYAATTLRDLKEHK